MLGRDPINAFFLPRTKHLSLSCADMRAMSIEQLEGHLNNDNTTSQQRQEIAKFVAICNVFPKIYRHIFAGLVFHIILLCGISWKITRMQKIVITRCGGEEAQELIRFSKHKDEILEAKGEIAFLSNRKGKLEIAPIRNSSAATGVGYSHL